MTENYFARIRAADAVIMTLGLVETWLDTRNGFYLNMAPSHAEIRKHPGRFRLVRTDAATNLKHLERMWEILTQISPRCRLVVTVSPVPMSASFWGEDVIVANIYSKSTLRSAAQAFVDAHDNVEYFPSYELVMMSRREAVFLPDWIHVEDNCVGRVLDAFISSHLGDTPRRFPEFRDGPYIRANPDVEMAVRRGEIASGYHHWVASGRAEGRPLSP